MENIVDNNGCILFLTGMPGAGKTYWGRKIAEHYDLPFTDLDILIEEREGATVPELFARHGEDGFRDLESRYLKELIDGTQNPAIVASGGGTPCFYDNMRCMKAAGVVVYLDADVELLIERLRGDAKDRPLLREVKHLDAHLHSMQQSRDKFYREAHYILPAQSISLTTFEEIIAACIKGR